MPVPRKNDQSRKLAGTFRKDRAVQPIGEAMLLAPPAWLSDPAKVVWSEIAEPLFEAGLTTSLDLHCLARYASAEGWRRESEAKGHHVQARGYSKLAADLAERLGLSPVARQRLPVVPKSDGNELSKLLG